VVAAFEPFFLSAGPERAGQRFCIHHPPRLAPGEDVHGAVVYVHPFAEEMNKSRRMAANGSRALAASGFAVLQIDLLGCGDSSGSFGDATWTDWLADVQLACTWARQRYDARLWLWGLRAGCLLASQVAAQLSGGAHTLFWQPPASGKQLLQQFLRLATASAMTQLDASSVKGGDKTSTPHRQRLKDGEAVEVAGYTLAPGLAGGLDLAQLGPPPGHTRSVWIETSTREGAGLLPATEAAAQRWRVAGHAVQSAIVVGPAFWQTQEIEDAPALLQATVQALKNGEGHTTEQAVPQAALNA
jgi:exosortase A-associated hydrolase 2